MDIPGELQLKHLEINEDRQTSTHCNPGNYMDYTGFTAKEHGEMLEYQEKQRKNDRWWHVGEIVFIALAAIGGGILGAVVQAWLSSPKP